MNSIEKVKTVSEPHKVIMVSNLSVDTKLDQLKVMFDNFETVVKISWVEETKNSIIAYFEDVIAAVRVVCFCNHNLLNGRVLRINFIDEENL